MTNTRLTLGALRGALAAVLLASVFPAHAVYRCVDAKGAVSYSVETCEIPQTGRELKVSPSATTSENFVQRSAGEYVRLPDAAGFYDRLRNWGSVNTDATPARLELSAGALTLEGNDRSKIICTTPGAVLSNDMLIAGEDASGFDSRIGPASEDVLPFFAMQCQAIEPKQLEKSVAGANNELVLPLLLSRINERSLMLMIGGRNPYVQIYQRSAAPPSTAPPPHSETPPKKR